MRRFGSGNRAGSWPRMARHESGLDRDRAPHQRPNSKLSSIRDWWAPILHWSGNPLVWRKASASAMAAARATLRDRSGGLIGIDTEASQASRTTSGTPALSRPNSRVSESEKVKSGNLDGALEVSRTRRPVPGPTGRRDSAPTTDDVSSRRGRCSRGPRGANCGRPCRSRPVQSGRPAY